MHDISTIFSSLKGAIMPVNTDKHKHYFNPIGSGLYFCRICDRTFTFEEVCRFKMTKISSRRKENRKAARRETRQFVLRTNEALNRNDILDGRYYAE